MSRASPANRADLSHENLYFSTTHNVLFSLMASFRFMSLKAAMPFNFSSPEFLIHHRTRRIESARLAGLARLI